MTGTPLLLPPMQDPCHLTLQGPSLASARKWEGADSGRVPGVTSPELGRASTVCLSTLFLSKVLPKYRISHHFPWYGWLACPTNTCGPPNPWCTRNVTVLREGDFKEVINVKRPVISGAPVQCGWCLARRAGQRLCQLLLPPEVGTVVLPCSRPESRARETKATRL